MQRSGRNIVSSVGVGKGGSAPATNSALLPKLSGSREVARQFALEFGKVTGDHGDVETPQDRFLRLAIKQELECCFDAPLGRVRAHRQSFASLSCHRDVMASLAVSHTDGDLEFKWIAFAGSLDLDHSSVQFGCLDRCSLTRDDGSKKVAKDRRKFHLTPLRTDDSEAKRTLPDGTATARQITLGVMSDFPCEIFGGEAIGRRRFAGIWDEFLIHGGLEWNCRRGRLLGPQVPRASERLSQELTAS